MQVLLTLTCVQKFLYFTYGHVPVHVHYLDLCAGVADLDLRAATSVPSVPRNARRELHPANQVTGLTHYAGFVHIRKICVFLYLDPF